MTAYLGSNAPSFRIYFHTGRSLRETGAAWPNRNGTGLNLQLDSVYGSRQIFLVPNTDRDGQPVAGGAPYKALYPTGRSRMDGRQVTRQCGVAHVSPDGLGYELFVADPMGNMRLRLRPLDFDPQEGQPVRDEDVGVPESVKDLPGESGEVLTREQQAEADVAERFGRAKSKGKPKPKAKKQPEVDRVQARDEVIAAILAQAPADLPQDDLEAMLDPR